MNNQTPYQAWATWSEIQAQPEIWREWAKSCDWNSHRNWIASHTPQEVWFCGAGTSAYIGDIITAGFEHLRGLPRFRSVASTDLVARPHDFLSDRTPLIVNFGRSGNSSESVGTLQALAALAPDAPVINITCNGDSALANSTGKNHRAIILPQATHDSGFAMTSSFSTMLHTALGLFDPMTAPEFALPRAADVFANMSNNFETAVGPAPERIVFLGTGPMCFAAREAALKVMELTAGKIPCLWDSILGFRHGPKSFVTDATRIVVFTGTDHNDRQYETDLITELKSQFPKSCLTTIGPKSDLDMPHPDGILWAAPNAIAFAQMAAVIWAHEMGQNVDDPFASQGTLSRVVSGVKLYEVSA